MDEVLARRVLGVSEAATGVEIEMAFRSLVMTAHPDRGGAPEAFRTLVEARQALSNLPVARRPPAVTVVPDANLIRQIVAVLLRRVSAGHDARRRVE